MNIKACLTHNSDEWKTPKALFQQLNEKYKFNVDLCSTNENALCEEHYTKEKTYKELKNKNIYCNPPYSQLKKWIIECDKLSKNNLVVMLIPARTDTIAFHTYIYKKHEIEFIKGRLHFSEKGPAPFPSMIVIMKNHEN